MPTNWIPHGHPFHRLRAQFPPVSKELEFLSTTIKKLDCLAFYKSYVFPPDNDLKIKNLSESTLKKESITSNVVSESVSGTATVGEAGAEGFGTVLSGSLERSNVDITEELVNLITAQRNFQANAKSIETTAATTQAIVNIRM